MTRQLSAYAIAVIQSSTCLWEYQQHFTRNCKWSIKHRAHLVLVGASFRECEKDSKSASSTCCVDDTGEICICNIFHFFLKNPFGRQLFRDLSNPVWGEWQEKSEREKKVWDNVEGFRQCQCWVTLWPVSAGAWGQKTPSLSTLHVTNFRGASVISSICSLSALLNNAKSTEL